MIKFPILKNDFMAASSWNFILLISGFIGFVTGLNHFTWQHAVEGAQAVSGIVQYPEPSPYFLYQIKAWTLLHQIPAIFLKWGLSEAFLSFIISGLMGMLSYQCLAGIFYTFSGDKLLSLLIPSFIDAAGLLNMGSAYPIILTGEVYTYGSIGFSWAFLSLLLIAHGQYGRGGFCLGLLPALHVSLGILSVPLLTAAAVWRIRSNAVRKILPGLAFGLLISFISFLVHYFTVPRINPWESFSKSEIIEFIKIWDSHRNLNFENPMLLLLMIGLLGAFSLLYNTTAPDDSKPALHMAKILSVFTLGALFFSLLWHIPLNWFPLPVIQLMPTRLANFPIFAFLPAFLGILRRNTRSAEWPFWMIAALLIVIVHLPAHDRGKTFIAAAYIFLAGAVIFSKIHPQIFAYTPPPRLSPLFFLKYSVIGYLFIQVITYGISFEPLSPRYAGVYADQSRDPFFRQVSKSNGFLLPGPDLYWMQIKTRRPILLDVGALDISVYFPELGRHMDKICKEIYGFDMIPEQGAPYKGLDFNDVYDLWTNRPETAWRALKKKYGVSEVLTAKWPLKLPLKTSSNEFDLYTIPD